MVWTLSSNSEEEGEGGEEEGEEEKEEGERGGKEKRSEWHKSSQTLTMMWDETIKWSDYICLHPFLPFRLRRQDEHLTENGNIIIVDTTHKHSSR